MGLAVASEAQYQDAVRRLFPQGEYWDEQFSDPQSDASLFVKAKIAELLRLRKRMSALLDESGMETTGELIADWERVYLDAVFPNLPLDQRRQQLKSKTGLKLNREELRKTAAMFGFTITNIEFPYRPGFFGHSRFGDKLATMASFSVIRFTLYRAEPPASGREPFTEFEKAITDKLLANHIPIFYYTGG